MEPEFIELRIEGDSVDKVKDLMVDQNVTDPAEAVGRCLSFVHSLYQMQRAGRILALKINDGENVTEVPLTREHSQI